MNSLAQILIQAQSSSQDLRNQSLTTLTNFFNSDPASFFLKLSQLLFDETVPKDSRILSGLYLKNRIKEIWDHIPADFKSEIKQNCLGSLASPDFDIVKTGASAVSTLALLEFSKGKWKEVLDILSTNAHNIHATFKHASLLTIGYISESLNPAFLTKDETNKILTATISNLVVPEETLREVALKALRNSLKFYEHNFENPHECKAILTQICNNFSSFPELCLQLLCDIVLYYPGAFIGNLDLIGNVTYGAMRSSQSEIAKSGMEVWCMIGEVERNRMNDGFGTFGYMETASNSLISLLLPKLLEKDEDDEWTEPKASYLTLCGIVQVCGNKHFCQVLNFVDECLKETNNGEKVQAGLLALASMFEDTDSLPKEINKLVGNVIELIGSSIPLKKKSAIWFFGRICPVYHHILGKCEIVKAKELLLKVLETDSKLQSSSCLCLTTIFTTCFDYFDHHEYSKILATCLRLTGLFPPADLPTLYSLLWTIVEKMPNQYSALLEKYFPEILSLFSRSCTSSETTYTCLASILQLFCLRLAPNKIEGKDCDYIISTILDMFAVHHKIFDESLQVVGALAMNLGENFSKYLHPVSGYLIYSLNQLDSSGILRSGIMAMSDFARSLGLRIAQYAGEIIPPLIKVLESAEVCITSKVLCINCLGDIAGGIQERFIEFLPTVLKYMDEAAGASLQVTEDLDVDDSLRELRESVLEFYVGLLQGLGSCKQQDVVRAKVPSLVVYISMVIGEKYRPGTSSHEAALGLIGDIVVAYGDSALVYILMPYVKKFLNEEPRLAKIAMWIMHMVNDCIVVEN